MKSTRNILLFIGTLGILASIYGFATGSSVTEYLIGFICSSSLILGYFDFKKHKSQSC
ncbi:hypothetical protein [Winogradskyella sp. MIT101101]|uniref:hypothetical protein n=1 Tax=Winogradskyella sp. MIT101101 TaxID=3098297 RepID=UPI003999BB0C